VLIAMVTQVIGDNVARAFSLVGALSIVRFRTVVQDTKDTAFVIFAVIVGMAVGAGQYTVAVCGLAAVGAAAGLFRDRSGFALDSPGRLLLAVRLGWSPDAERLAREAARTGDVSKILGAGGGAKEKTLEFLREMRMTFLPKASIGGLGGVGSSAQLAFSNQSPFEVRMLERMNTAISTLEAILGAAKGEPEPVFGDGKR